LFDKLSKSIDTEGLFRIPGNFAICVFSIMIDVCCVGDNDEIDSWQKAINQNPSLLNCLFYIGFFFQNLLFLVDNESIANQTRILSVHSAGKFC
jgi:hypothetical protein